jgi:hypothetical protein
MELAVSEIIRINYLIVYNPRSHSHKNILARKQKYRPKA